MEQHAIQPHEQDKHHRKLYSKAEQKRRQQAFNAVPSKQKIQGEI